MYSLGIIEKGFLGIILSLDSFVYSLITSAYKIFMAIASAELLSSKAYQNIAEKVYIIIGVGMLFVLAYAILKAIVDPDQLSKGDMAGGKMLKSIAIAVIGLIVTPLIFNLAYVAQGKMLEDDILGKLFFRTEDSTVPVSGVGKVNYDEALHHTGGAVAATSVWQAFFYPAEGEDPEKIIADAEVVRMNANIAAGVCAASAVTTVVGIVGGFFTAGVGWAMAGASVLACVNAVVQDSNADDVEEAIGEDGEISLTEAFAMTSAGESFTIFQGFIEPIDEGKIKYTWFVSTVCGAFVAYAFACYAIDMGVRAAKLAYYQIIAPIPLILSVLPKNGDRVGKYVKGVMTTFLDVFVRISVVYIVIYIIAHLNELFSRVGVFAKDSGLTNVEQMIAMALLIIGLVLFAKQAPKFIAETFGLNGGVGLDGLNIMKKLRDGEVFTAGSIIGGTALSGVKNFRDSWGKSKGQKLHKRIGRAVGSSVIGSGSGAVRSTYGRLKGGKDGAVANFKDMTQKMEKTADAVTDAKNQRKRMMDENRFREDGSERSVVERYAVGRAKKVADKLDAFTSPTVDTSYDDQTISLLGKVADQRDTFRTKTGKVDEQRYVQRLVEALKSEGPPREFNEDAYKAALTAAAQSVVRTSGMSDDDYIAAVNAATASVDRENFRNHDYASQLAEYQRKTNAAEKMHEASQDVAFLQLLKKKDAATIASLQQFFTDNITELQAKANVLVDDGRGGQITLAKLFEQQYGLNISTGQVDTSKIVSQPVEYVITKTDGSSLSYKVSIDGNGIATYRDQHGRGLSLEEITQVAASPDVSKVEATTAINTATDRVKAAKNAKISDAEYIRDKTRQRKQQEKKNS